MRRLFWNGTTAHAVVLAIAGAIALVVVGTMAWLVTADWDVVFGGAMLTVVCAGGAIGIVLGLRFDPLQDLVGVRAGERTKTESTRTFGDVGLVAAFVAVAALPFGGVYAVQQDDPTGWAMSAVFAFVTGMGAIGGLLVDWLLVLPVAALVRVIVRPRRSSRIPAAAGALFLTIAGFATLVVLSGSSTLDAAETRGARAVALLEVVLGAPDDEVVHPALLWGARAAGLALVASMVWLALEARADRRHRTRGAAVADHRLGGAPDAD